MDSLDAIERINILLREEKITRDELSRRTGISYNRWLSVIQKKTQLRHGEIQALGEIWPDYKMWLAFGEEMPEVGQISPMTKKAQEDLGTAGKAG
ncbi:XRE family transcriptional regulator [Gilvimarinus japonicus]|uniref:XRE family transcriptional regulator n=1 Tax=Gilvimarinus japonicus TaxID=1796469 RepID=A0ABV7HSX6_9GAMM